MEDGSFTFTKLVHRSEELNRKKAEMQVLIQLVVGSLNAYSKNVPVHISHVAKKIGDHKYVWDISAGHNGDLILVRWSPEANVVTGLGGKSEGVWRGRDASGIPATAVDEVYEAMDFLLEQARKFVGGFDQKLAKIIGS